MLWKKIVDLDKASYQYILPESQLIIIILFYSPRFLFSGLDLYHLVMIHFVNGLEQHTKLTSLIGNLSMYWIWPYWIT